MTGLEGGYEWLWGILPMAVASLVAVKAIVCSGEDYLRKCKACLIKNKTGLVITTVIIALLAIVIFSFRNALL